MVNGGAHDKLRDFHPQTTAPSAPVPTTPPQQHQFVTLLAWQHSCCFHAVGGHIFHFRGLCSSSLWVPSQH